MLQVTIHLCVCIQRVPQNFCQWHESGMHFIRTAVSFARIEGPDGVARSPEHGRVRNNARRSDRHLLIHHSDALGCHSTKGLDSGFDVLLTSETGRRGHRISPMAASAAHSYRGPCGVYRPGQQNKPRVDHARDVTCCVLASKGHAITTRKLASVVFASRLESGTQFDLLVEEWPYVVPRNDGICTAVEPFDRMLPNDFASNLTTLRGMLAIRRPDGGGVTQVGGAGLTTKSYY